MNSLTSTAKPALRAPLAALAIMTAVTLLGGCAAPLLVGGAMAGGAMSFTDRRTTGTQLEDETIELKSGGRLREVLGDRSHVNVTSFNRLVLITGETPTEADRVAAEKAVAQIENVRATLNELAVGGNSAMTARANDTLVTSKVKASYLDAKDLQSNAIKVVTERGTVFLMGRVTERESTRAGEIARGVGGVARVVKAFEVISDADLAKLQSR